MERTGTLIVWGAALMTTGLFSGMVSGPNFATAVALGGVILGCSSISASGDGVILGVTSVGDLLDSITGNHSITGEIRS